ncbi:unnamed protein product [Gongylonema pulchrum]|uniref:BAH domain-containing protein n=1 Tax=Gongylonema pulchrum TaxID=637853 RepID=A0A183DD12_9BILA|nr:unnamed protein product [Gongylonema pulchrum]
MPTDQGHHQSEARYITGIPFATVLWYYSPRQVKIENPSPPIASRELFASRHIDLVQLDTVDEIVFVLTYNEYARFVLSPIDRKVVKKRATSDLAQNDLVKFLAETVNDMYPPEQRVTEEKLLWRRGEDNYPRRQFLPFDDTPLESVKDFS